VDKFINVQYGTFIGGNSIIKSADGPMYNGADTTAVGGATKTPGAAGYVCSNVYCHSDGNTYNGATPAFRNIGWDAGAIGCESTTCHGDGTDVHPKYASIATKPNSHVAHVESGSIGCDACHITATTDTAIPPVTVLPGGTHLDRDETVAFKTIESLTGIYDQAANTCSVTYCHSNSRSGADAVFAVPAWGGAAGCSDCHMASDTAAVMNTKNPSAAHIVHASTEYYGSSSRAAGDVVGCSFCHL